LLLQNLPKNKINDKQKEKEKPKGEPFYSAKFLESTRNVNSVLQN